MVASTVFAGVASAAAGSVVSGVVWQDTDRDSVHDGSESPRQASVTVRLFSQAGQLIATTTPDAQGRYAFRDLADGTYTVRVTSPSAFTFPAVATDDNDFTLRPPVPGQPHQGQSASLTIAGTTQVTGLDAGLQPQATIDIDATPLSGACQDLARTGQAPWSTSSTPPGAADTTASDCAVRTDDVITQQYSVSLTGLSAGGTIDNVVADFTIKADQAGAFAFDGGIPGACLTNAVTPPSSIQTRPNGDVVLHCNLGRFTSAVAPIVIPYQALPGTPAGTLLHMEVNAYAAGGDAAPSGTLVGPEIEIRTAPQYDLSKSLAGQDRNPAWQVVNGQRVYGYVVSYVVALSSLATKGNQALANPLTFTERLNDFPNAVLTYCSDAYSGQPGTIDCGPLYTPQGEDGITITLDGLTWDTIDIYQFTVRFFVPIEDAYRALDPSWQPGRPEPTGTVPLVNTLEDSEGWTDIVGNPNNTTGFEPGWDGTTATGNNRVSGSPFNVGPIPIPKPGTAIGTGKTFGPDTNPITPGKDIGSAVTLATDDDTIIQNALVCDVFDVSALELTDPTRNSGYFMAWPSGTGIAPLSYVIEYAEGPNDTNLMTPRTEGSLQAAVDGCGTAPGPWSTDPAAAFGPDWRDTVNMVRLRMLDPLPPDTAVRLNLRLTGRTVYNGGPNDGVQIQDNASIPNFGGWTDPAALDGWSTNPARAPFQNVDISITKSRPAATYAPGQTVPWTIVPRFNGAAVGSTVHDVRVLDTLPSGVSYDPVCTAAALPANVTVDYNPVARVVTLFYGDRIATAQNMNLPTATLCTTVSSLTFPGTVVTNRVQMSTPDAPTQPVATASVTIVGSGQLAVEKSVDTPLIESGDTYTWKLTWANTSGQVDMLAPDVIDVLPWNGDGDPGSLSRRALIPSSYAGAHGLSGPLAQPTYTLGRTGSVTGTWYYSTQAPMTISHDPRAASNATPQAAGGTWLTAAEVAGTWSQVTAVRFVSGEQLLHATGVTALIPERATSTVLNNVYVNRAMIFSATFPNQPLLSNEPFVMMPGFSLGDRVWSDLDGNGRFDASTDTAVPGVTVEVLDGAGAVVATTTTDANGRWFVQGLAPGTYTAHIPGSMFAAGAPLEGHEVWTGNSNTASDANEAEDNNNGTSADPRSDGLSSAPVTFAYIRNAAGDIIGGGQPTGDNPGRLGSRILPDDFTNFTVDLAATPTPRILLDKEVVRVDDANGNDLKDTGDLIVWRFTVTNDSPVTVMDVSITDPVASPISCPMGPLAPGSSVTCTADSPYQVTLSDMDIGHRDNTAVAHAVDPRNLEDVPSDEDSTDTPLDQVPGIHLNKRIASIVDVDLNGHYDAGDRISYEFVVTNTGNVTLTDIAVDDPLLNELGVTIECPQITLVPDQRMTCSAIGDYLVTQADTDAGHRDNTATTAGTPPSGPPVTDVDDVDQPLDREPGIELTKRIAAVTDVNLNFISDTGDLIRYEFDVTNTGNVTLTDVGITDPLLGAANIPLSCPVTVLAPQEQMTCTADAGYGVTVADTDRGHRPNTAAVLGTPPTGPPVTDEDDEDQPLVQVPSILLTKRIASFDDVDGGGLRDAGDEIRYEFDVTNIGNVTLTDVVVSDPLLGGRDIAISCPKTTLAPDESMTCVADRGYRVTQAETDAGHRDNTATVRGTPPTGPPVTDEDDEDQPLDQDPAIVLAKRIASFDDRDGDGLRDAGDEIHYEFEVTNRGNVTLADVTVTDPLLAGADVTITCPGSSLRPDESMVCTADAGYPVTQDDVDAGHRDNTAATQGSPPSGPPVTDEDDQDQLLDQAPAIELDKRVARVDDRDGDLLYEAGDLIWYEFEVVNTGNVTLDPVTVTDPMLAGANVAISCPDTVLSPDERMVCVALAGYVVTNTDVDAEKVHNVATAHGTPLTGGEVDDEDETSTPLGVNPAIELEKRIVSIEDANTNGLDDTGDLIHYEFVVSNTGNVTLHDITLTDPLLTRDDIAINCAATTLAAYSQMVCTAIEGYRVTQADTDAGHRANNADVRGLSPQGEEVTDEDEADQPLEQNPAIGLDKRISTITDVDQDGLTGTGDKIRYEFEVTNLGNVTLTDVHVTDPKLDDVTITITCPGDTLAPQESMICVSSRDYLVTAQDMAAGSVANHATVTGTPPDTCPPDSELECSRTVTADDQEDAPTGVPPIAPTPGGKLPDTGAPAEPATSGGRGGQLLWLAPALLAIACLRRRARRGE